MTEEKRSRREAAGIKVGSLAEFLGLTDEEERLIAFRVDVALAVRRIRISKSLTQQDVARIAKSTQSRIAKIESAASEVSLDLMLRALFAVGGGLSDVISHAEQTKPVTTQSLSIHATDAEEIYDFLSFSDASKNITGKVAG